MFFDGESVENMIFSRKNQPEDTLGQEEKKEKAEESVPKEEAVTQAAVQSGKPSEKEKKEKEVKTGKHGRPLKTDPYGNPIKKKKNGAPLRKSKPVRTVTPADIQKPQVSFLNSIANLEPASRARWTGATTAQAYDHAVVKEGEAAEGDYQPKIRRMSDSTRAKELRKKRSKLAAMNYAYEKDSPQEHSVVLQQPKRRKPKLAEDQLERIPDELMDQPYEELSEPIPLVEKAEHTQIDLSSGPMESVDIDVHYHAERRKRFDLPKEAKDFKNPEDKISIGNDINELKMDLSLRVFIVGLATFLSCLLTIFDWIPGFPLPKFLSSAHSPQSFLTVQILLGVLTIPFSGGLLKNGFMKLFRLKADCDSMASLGLVSALLAAVASLFVPQMLMNGMISVYISIALLGVWMNTISKKVIVCRAQRNFEVLANDEPKFAIHYVENERRAENLTKGTLGDLPILATMQPTKKVTDFLRYTFSSDLGDLFCRYTTPIVLLFSLFLAIFLGIIRRESVDNAFCYALWVFALSVSAGSTVGITLISNVPLANGTKRYVRGSGLLLGYQSVDDFYDVNTVMIDASTLFPQGSTKLESIQITGESRIEEALQYAASLTQHAGSILKDLFANAILTEEQMILPVEDYSYSEGNGLCGWIANKRVLLGKREMMIEHSIEGLPAASKEEEMTAGGNEAIYLSVSGTIGAMFIVNLSASRSVKKWLHELEQEEIHLLIRSNDALLSQRRLSRMFGFPEDFLKIIPTRLEQEYVEETQLLETANPSMICAGRLPGFVQTIVGAKRIRAVSTIGGIMQVVSACLGIGGVTLFLMLHAYDYLSGGILLIYHILCTLLTLATLNMREV